MEVNRSTRFTHPGLCQYSAFLLFLATTIALCPFATGQSTSTGTVGNHLEQRLTAADAVHLLSRTGIGAHPGVVLRYTGLTRATAVKQVLQGLADSPDTPMPDWVEAAAPAYMARGAMSVNERASFDYDRDRELEELRAWWIGEMIQTTSPQTERLVLFWHNHFVSAYSAIGKQSTSMARQNRLFRKHAAGNFGEFLRAVLRDPAMLDYLDNRSSHKKSPNENLGRELLELFTLGEGNYQESDVKNAARALTGYSVAPAHNMSFRFLPYRHDFDNKTLFGQTGAFDADDLVDLLLEQPETSKHIALKFWRAYVNSTEVNEAAVNSIAAVFHESGYDIRELLHGLLAHPDFWSDENRYAVIKSPVDLVVGTLRTRGASVANINAVAAALTEQGQNLFEPPNVAGWPGGASWISPNRLLSRVAWLSRFGADRLELGARAAGIQADSMSEGMSMGMARETSMQGVRVVARLASDDLDGAPEVRVELLNGNEVVWLSDVVTLKPGRDTVIAGVGDNNSSFIWKKYTFKALESTEAPAGFDRVRLHFLNDHFDGDGDRNLYVDWVKVDQQLYRPFNGTQSSDCVPESPFDAGYLFCAGYLEIPAGTSNAMADNAAEPLAAMINQQGLKVGNAYFQRVQNPLETAKPTAKRKTSDLVINLADIEYGDRHWHNLQAFVRVDRNNNYKLVFDRYACWPDCFQSWPDCTERAEHDPYYRAVSVLLPLDREGLQGDSQAHRNNRRNHCGIDDLQQDDQALVSAIWNLLPQFYESVKQDRSLRRRRNAEFFANWLPHIDKVAAAAPEPTSTPVSIPKPPIEQSQNSLEQVYFAAGQSPEVWRDAVSFLMQQSPMDETLNPLFLPVSSTRNSGEASESITTQSLQKRADFKAFLLRPEFQLK